MRDRDILLTVKEYAALFDVTPRAVYGAIHDGCLPYPVVRPLGGAPRIRVPLALAKSLRISSVEHNS